MQEISRRDFLRISALAAGGAALGACHEGRGGPQEPPVYTPTASVAAVRGYDLYGMTREALEDIGGIEQVVQPGETVFIKPNMVTLPWAQYSDRFRIGECTKPEIIIAVAEECLKAGATEVIVGDASHMPVLEWEYATTLDGSTNLAAEAERLSSQYEGNMRVASLEVDSPAWVEVPSRTYLGVIAISSLVAHADRVISIPVAKTHAWAQLTLSLKNFIGVTPLERYAHWVDPGYWDRGMAFDHSSTRSIAAIYLDIVDAVKPDLAVVDFSIGVEGDGPSVGPDNGSTVDMRGRLGSWLVLASTDIVAVDATAARIMSHDVGAVTQLRMAHEMGLGEINESLIEIVGERLRDLQVEWNPARLRNRLGTSPTVAPACPFARQLAHRLG
jgi:uncharacterized protein (DUF362 family)